MEKPPTEASVESVSAEEFARILKELRPDLTQPLIDRVRAEQIVDKSGSVRILVNNEGFPSQFMPYLETHVLCEIRMANRKGFNLNALARKDALKALRAQYPRISETVADRLLSEFVKETRFDFKHEFAVWKEYQQADGDGKLDEYHAFVISLKESEQAKYTDCQSIVRQTRNDMSIRQSIFSKIKTGSKHHFIRRLNA